MARPRETWPSLVALVLMRVCFGIIFIVLACFSASIALLNYVTVSLFDSVLYANDCVQRAKEAGYQTLGTLLLQSMSWVLGHQQAYGLTGMLQRLALWVCHAMLLTGILSHCWLHLSLAGAFFLTSLSTLALVAMCFRVLDRTVAQLTQYFKFCRATSCADRSSRRGRRTAVLASQKR